MKIFVLKPVVAIKTCFNLGYTDWLNKSQCREIFKTLYVYLRFIDVGMKDFIHESCKKKKKMKNKQDLIIVEYDFLKEISRSHHNTCKNKYFKPIDGDLKGYLSGRSTRTFHTPPSYAAAKRRQTN